MKIGVLALQGAFAEHIAALKFLGTECCEIRNKQDLHNSVDGLILPGGESTVQGKLLKELDMLEHIREMIIQGLPVLGTCAGAILLAEKIENDNHRYFATLPVTIVRNGYGRQLGSFKTYGRFQNTDNVPMTFIRAPYIQSVRQDVEVLAEHEGKITAVRYGRQMAVTFHPELDILESSIILKSFLALCK